MKRTLRLYTVCTVRANASCTAAMEESLESERDSMSSPLAMMRRENAAGTSPRSSHAAASCSRCGCIAFSWVIGHKRECRLE